MPSAFPIPLNAIRAIEIVARRGALAPAAEELGVTPGAVSQHIRRAELRLGLELFERTNQGLRPTPALTAILPQLGMGFAALADALATLRAGDDRVLTLTVGSVFASRFLVWRLGKFAARHPEFELRLVVTGTPIDLTHSDIDCGIRYGRGRWPGLSAERIGGTSFSPVAAPALAEKLRTPADLAHVPVIRDTATMLSWSEWFAAAGLPDPPPTSGPTYDDPALAFDAATTGLGVLMAVDMMSEFAVRDGRLVRPFDVAVINGLGYWFIVPEARREPKKVRLFRQWLREEVAEERNNTASPTIPSPPSP
jgi:DNA-binding transcriptional LysR family regulator